MVGLARIKFTIFPCVFFQGGQQCQMRRASIFGQQVFVENLVKLAKLIAKESGNRHKKVNLVGCAWIKVYFPESLGIHGLCYVRYEMTCSSN